MKNKKVQFLKENNIKVGIQHYPKIRKNIKLTSYFFKLYDEECVYCKLSRPYNMIPLEIDHFEPKSVGDNHDIENLVCSCQRCNRNKNDIEFKEFDIHPDLKRYWEYWGLDTKYYTVIKNEYSTKSNIKHIYDNFRLHTEDRRMINMCIELKKLKKQKSNEIDNENIEKIVEILENYLLYTTVSKE